ncbi:phosphate ABC transporter permease subunit PstC [Pelagicoccus sp. SDUM812002]|uniref:phosphate ABC transporter permease subunit PstC n=1 Tax=Pelagicoccus sp. SDUM812002 TaxID=3041266 RepID=UPI00280CE2C0|nr:phosphate ABC transporter permease subunit PstC [Pelagicoccus sp. SDUM812002]MDQ8187848.1 phosphate ABC transporter permease subunit PstC [Pelagicoccus sp. SDUM812002]
MAKESKSGRYDLHSRRRRVLGLDKGQALKGLFGGNALVSVIVLALITFFLFKEGAGFFGQYRHDIELYRKSGLEYVEIMKKETDSFSELNRYLNSIRGEHASVLKERGLSFAEAKAELSSYEDFIYNFEDLGYPLREYVLEMNEVAIGARNMFVEASNYREHRENLLALGRDEEAAEVEVLDVDLSVFVEMIKEGEPDFLALNDKVAVGIIRLTDDLPTIGIEKLDDKMQRFKELALMFVSEMDGYETRLAEWDPQEPVGMGSAFASFVFGKDWVTNSSIQDWYGILPLFTGSLLVASIAMVIAIPLGVGAAIYINQVATPAEQNFIKPYIEFISAIPSVVIGFFGIAVFGEFVRQASGWAIFSGLDAFPISERLTAFTAGCLLALMAIPTIFTLAEDAINNVPKSFKEASLAMGATRLQTTMRIIVPTSLSGIISAILLGFGRVIGETMVVLLCAGNRIEIPDFTDGLATFFEPVHTMTGIIAQELGEVVNGSIHYRALFMVGMVLFLLSLLINYLAQKIVLKYQVSRG